MRKEPPIIAVWFATLVICIADPAPVKNSVLKPTFLTGRESFTAGTAFVCESPDGKGHLLLTAHHLLGTAGGFESELAWDKLNDVIKLTVAISMDDPAIHVVSRKALLITNAHALDNRGLADDVAAFPLEYDKSRQALMLAKDMPKAGERLWLYGRQRGGDKLELIPCVVTSSNARELNYAFDGKSVKLAGTSGAPILNADGHVVAINIGGTDHNGRLIGYGNPTASVVVRLERATK